MFNGQFVRLDVDITDGNKMAEKTLFEAVLRLSAKSCF